MRWTGSTELENKSEKAGHLEDPLVKLSSMVCRRVLQYIKCPSLDAMNNGGHSAQGTHQETENNRWSNTGMSLLEANVVWHSDGLGLSKGAGGGMGVAHKASQGKINSSGEASIESPVGFLGYTNTIWDVRELSAPFKALNLTEQDIRRYIKWRSEQNQNRSNQ